jgi:hypothetical protein
LGVLRKVVEVAVDQKRVDSRLLTERIDRVLVGRRQKWLADVEEQQLDVRLGAHRQKVLHQPHFEISVARSECNDLQWTIPAFCHDSTSQAIKRVLGSVRRHILNVVAHRDIRQRAAMFQIGVGLFDVTAGAVQYPHKLLHHPHRVVTRRNVAVVVGVRRWIACARLRRIIEYILPSQRQFFDS